MGLTASRPSFDLVTSKPSQDPEKPLPNIPIEILEIILIFVWHGSVGTPGGGSLKQSQLVNRTWYLISSRVMMSFVFIESASDLRRCHSAIHSPAPATSAASSKFEKGLGIGGRKRQGFRLSQALNRLRSKKLEPAGEKTEVGAVRHLAVDAAYLCHSLECLIQPGCVSNVVSWEDLVELLPLLPNLRYFALRTRLTHPGIHLVLEELADRDTILEEDTNADADSSKQKQNRENRAKLETLELSLRGYRTNYPAPIRLRPGLSLGIRHLSLHVPDVRSIGAMLSHCRPETLETLRLMGPIDLSASAFANSLAQLMQVRQSPSALRILVLSTKRPGEREWPHVLLRLWNIPALLKNHPMPGLGRICIEGGPRTRLNSEGMIVTEVGVEGDKFFDLAMKGWNEIVEACMTVKIPLESIP